MKHDLVSQVLGVHRVSASVSVWVEFGIVPGSKAKWNERPLTADIQASPESLPVLELNLVSKDAKELVKSRASALCLIWAMGN